MYATCDCNVYKLGLYSKVKQTEIQKVGSPQKFIKSLMPRCLYSPPCSWSEEVWKLGLLSSCCIGTVRATTSINWLQYCQQVLTDIDAGMSYAAGQQESRGQWRAPNSTDWLLAGHRASCYHCTTDVQLYCYTLNCLRSYTAIVKSCFQ